MHAFHRRPIPRALVGIALAAAAGAASAQGFPNRPIKLMVGYLAGGGVDITARHLADAVKDSLGQVVVENRAGASGMLAASAVAKSPPDGYTLLLSAAGEIATNPHLYKQKMQYDPDKDLAPVTNVVMMPNVLIVNTDVPASTVAEFVTWAKARPGKLTFSSSGIGNPLHLSGELFNRLAGTEITHVPYKGAAQQTADVAAKHITMTFASVAAVQPFLKGNQVKALAVSSKKRVTALPGVPTVAETPGPLSAYELVNWYGLFAPAGTPADVIAKLNAEVTKVLRSPEFAAKMTALGGEADPMTPTQFRDFTRAESAKFKRIIDDAKVVLTD
jgi:tripartite-type tricarboxylate transporter receptor subunit TctC